MPWMHWASTVARFASPCSTSQARLVETCSRSCARESSRASIDLLQFHFHRSPLPIALNLEFDDVTLVPIVERLIKVIEAANRLARDFDDDIPEQDVAS